MELYVFIYLFYVWPFRFLVSWFFVLQGTFILSPIRHSFIYLFLYIPPSRVTASLDINVPPYNLPRCNPYASVYRSSEMNFLHIHTKSSSIERLRPRPRTRTDASYLLFLYLFYLSRTQSPLFHIPHFTTHLAIPNHPFASPSTQLDSET